MNSYAAFALNLLARTKVLIEDSHHLCDNLEISKLGEQLICYLQHNCDETLLQMYILQTSGTSSITSKSPKSVSS